MVIENFLALKIWDEQEDVMSTSITNPHSVLAEVVPLWLSPLLTLNHYLIKTIMKVKVTKVSAQPSKNGNFIHTVKTEGKIINVLGVNKTSGALTYFIALPSAVAVGSEHDINMDQFRVEERPYEVADQATGEVQTLMLKWLHIK